MSDKIFVDGVFVKTITTQYGDIQKLSFDLEKFKEFCNAHAQKSEKNGKWYLNVDFLSTQEGKKYMALDTFKPDPNYQAQPPQQQPAPSAPSFTANDLAEDTPF